MNEFVKKTEEEEGPTQSNDIEMNTAWQVAAKKKTLPVVNSNQNTPNIAWVSIAYHMLA